MSHDAEAAEPDLADVVYQFNSLGREVISQCRDTDLSLADLQNLRATANATLEAIERAMRRDPVWDRCTCPSVRWQIPEDSPRTHMLKCPEFTSASDPDGLLDRSKYPCANCGHLISAEIWCQACMDQFERAVGATRNPRHRCICYPSGRLNLAPSDGHIITCPLRRLGPE